jgi:hypothetical protein
MLFGDALDSAVLVSELEGNYVICNPEVIGPIADRQGALSIRPPVEAVVDTNYKRVNSYHAWFASFLEINHRVIIDHGADDLRIFMEVFYAKNLQCNFEIFDKESVSVFGKFNVTLPISIYALRENVIVEWAKEIEQDWQSNGCVMI